MEDFTFTDIRPSPDQDAALRRRQRIEARRRALQRKRRNRRIILGCTVIAALTCAIFLFNAPKGQEPSDAILPEQPVFTSAPLPEPEAVPFAPVTTDETLPLGDELNSLYAVILDVENNTVIAEKDAHAVISPASMTKVLTLLVAAERVENPDDPFTMTIDITDYAYVNDCSVVGLMVGETVSVRELMYGTILPSGADAALGLAVYVAGSHEAFVDLMNEKLEELGLSETAHFTNCVGLYDDAHKCTVYDMAIIMKAAMENELCREILDARTFETLPTADHPEGQILSNWFLRRIEDKDTGDIEVIGGKTGYVTESGSCAVSAGEDAQGNLFIIATGDAEGSWKCIYDHVALYHDHCSTPDGASPQG